MVREPSASTALRGADHPGERGGAPRLGLAVLGLASFLALFLWLRGGALLLPQAGMQSVLAADSLCEGRGLELAPGQPFSKYPPLYPLLLAPARAVGLDVIEAVYLVNAATLAATLCVLYDLAARAGARWALLAPALYALLAAPHYLLRAARADAVPILASLVCVSALVRYGRNGSLRALVAAALACAVGGLARYMAMVTLVPFGCVAAFWLAGRLERRRLRDTTVFALVAGIPPGLWLLRNQLVKGFVFGIPKVSEARAGAEGTDFANNVTGLVKTFFIDLFGYDALGVIRVVYGQLDLPHPIALRVGAALAAALTLALVVSLRRSAPSPRGDLHVLLGTWVVLYALAIVVIWTVGQNDPVHTRYVAPLYGPLLILLMSLGQRSLEAGPARWKRVALVLLACTVLVPNVPKTAQLLGEEPDQRVLELVSRQGLTRWHRDLAWDLGTP